MQGLIAFKFNEITNVTVEFNPEVESSLDLHVLRRQTPQHKKDAYFKEQENIKRAFFKFLQYFIDEKVCYP